LRLRIKRNSITNMASANAGEKQQIPLHQLPIQQLDNFKKQVEQELELLVESMNQLKLAQSKLQSSSDNLDHVTEGNEGKEIMVPMTSSMYVSGVLDECAKVLVDVGTGYYVEKTVEEARKYFQRKNEFIGKQMEKIQPMLMEKQQIRQAVLEAYQMKMQMQMKQQQAAQTAS